MRPGAALIVGVGSYLHADRVGTLNYTTRDASAVAGLLTSPEVGGFPPERVLLRTDAEAGRDELVGRLSRWLPEQSRGAEIALIYFAGHGLVHRLGPRDEGYILPHDGDPDDPVTRGIAMSDLARWVEAIEAETVVVCLDCCHAGRVTTRSGPAMALGLSSGLGTRDLKIRPSLLEGLAGKGRFLMASCNEGQVSIESEALGHGLFTHYLLLGLRGEADLDRDGRVGVAELFEYVARSVAGEARRLGFEQDPWHQASGRGGAYLSMVSTGCNGQTMIATEGLPIGDGPDAMVEAAEQSLASGEADRLLQALDWLRQHGTPRSVPVAFSALAHADTRIRERARAVLKSVGWDRVVASVLELAREPGPSRLGPILDGLAAFEAHRDVVALLDQLVVRLRGEMRNRTILLLERKKLSLDIENVAEVFEQLKSPYRLQKVLGQGLFTAAYLARDENSEHDVVVRVLRGELASQPEARARFLDLGRRSIHMVHENLVLTREVRSVPERQFYYVVRDHIGGMTLQRLIDSGHVFSADQVSTIVRQILGGLKPVHRIGLAHGGIKPSNIFLTAGDRVVVGDLSLPSHGLTLEFDRLTYDYRYAPPELFAGQRETEPRSDLFSIGCLIYELCQGHPPFTGENPYELASKILRDPVPPLRNGHNRFRDDAGARFLDRLLARSLDDRFPNLYEATRALDSLSETDWYDQLELCASMDEFEPPTVELPPLPSPTTPAPTTPPAPTVGSALPLPPTGGSARWSSESHSGMVGDQAIPGELAMNSIISFHGFREDTVTLEGIGSPNQTYSFTVASEPAHFEPPERIGRYEVLATIGKGGMASVHRARDLSLQRLVALKIAPRRPGVGDELWARFNREATAVARLQHPNIVQIHDVGQIDDAQYLVLELVDGGSLQAILARGPMPPDDAARMLATLARAIQFAHDHRVLHRDLKPANILLTRDGIPKITDFGLAKFMMSAESQPLLGMELAFDDEDANTTMTGTVLGTPNYMAPEQAFGVAGEIGPAVDVYALGVILYEALTGRRPFVGHSVSDILQQVQTQAPPAPHSLRAEVPTALGAICLKCLEKQPAARYATAGLLAEDLDRFLSNLPVRARPTPPSPSPSATAERPTARVPRRRRWFRFW